MLVFLSILYVYKTTNFFASWVDLVVWPLHCFFFFFFFWVGFCWLTDSTFMDPTAAAAALQNSIAGRMEKTGKKKEAEVQSRWWEGGLFRLGFASLYSNAKEKLKEERSFWLNTLACPCIHFYMELCINFFVFDVHK